MTEPVPDRLVGTSRPILGILLDTNPVAIGYPIDALMGGLATPIDGLEVGDIVRGTAYQLTFPSGPGPTDELAVRTVFVGIEAAFGEPDRIGIAVTYTRYGKQPLDVRDDGGVLSGGRHALQLTDAELADLLKTFGAASFSTARPAMPREATLVGDTFRGGTITLACGRLQTASIELPALAPLVAALDALEARIEARATYRVQYASREKIEWLDLTSAESISDRQRIPEELRAALTRRVFVRDGDKVYRIEGGIAYECTRIGKCHLWSPEHAPFDPEDQAGPKLSRDQLTALGLGFDDWLDRTDDPIAVAVVVDHVYRGLAVWRDLPGPSGAPAPARWRLVHSGKNAVVGWPAAAPALASFAAERRRVQAPGYGARTDMPGEPMYASVPTEIVAAIGREDVFEERGVVYRVRSRCNDPSCGAGTFFGLEVSPLDAQRWSASGLPLASVPADGLVIAPEQFEANQRLLESLDQRMEIRRDGDAVYRWVSAGPELTASPP